MKIKLTRYFNGSKDGKSFNYQVDVVYDVSQTDGEHMIAKKVAIAIEEQEEQKVRDNVVTAEDLSGSDDLDIEEVKVLNDPAFENKAILKENIEDKEVKSKKKRRKKSS